MQKISLEENGHVVLLGVFDCVDDTVLVKKALLSVSTFSLNYCVNYCDFYLSMFIAYTHTHTGSDLRAIRNM